MPDTPLLRRPRVRDTPRQLPPVTESAEPPIRLDRRSFPHTRVSLRRALVPLFCKIAHDPAATDSTMLVRSSDLAPVRIPRQPLRRTRPCHRDEYDTPAVRCNVLPKFPMLVAGAKWSAVIARPPSTAPARTTPTPVSTDLSPAAHRPSGQARHSAQLCPLLRDCLPAPLQSRSLAVSPRPPLRRPQTPQNAGSIPFVCWHLCLARLKTLPPVRIWSAPLRRKIRPAARAMMISRRSASAGQRLRTRRAKARRVGHARRRLHSRVTFRRGGIAEMIGEAPD
jgi:hypothetical protein